MDSAQSTQPLNHIVKQAHPTRPYFVALSISSKDTAEKKIIYARIGNLGPQHTKGQLACSQLKGTQMQNLRTIAEPSPRSSITSRNMAEVRYVEPAVDYSS